MLICNLEDLAYDNDFNMSLVELVRDAAAAWRAQRERSDANNHYRQASDCVNNAEKLEALAKILADAYTL